MKEKNYRKFEVFYDNREPSAIMNIEKNENDFNVKMPKIKKTLSIKSGDETIMYQKFSGNVRDYDVIFVGGIKRSEEYFFKGKKYVDVETIENKYRKMERVRRKEITDLLTDSKKNKENQEVVYFHTMEHYQNP